MAILTARADGAGGSSETLSSNLALTITCSRLRCRPVGAAVARRYLAMRRASTQGNRLPRSMCESGILRVTLSIL